MVGRVTREDKVEPIIGKAGLLTKHAQEVWPLGLSTRPPEPVAFHIVPERIRVVLGVGSDVLWRWLAKPFSPGVSLSGLLCRDLSCPPLSDTCFFLILQISAVETQAFQLGLI